MARNEHWTPGQRNTIATTRGCVETKEIDIQKKTDFEIWRKHPNNKKTYEKKKHGLGGFTYFKMGFKIFSRKMS